MLQFLKLGGSLITDKSKPHTLRQDVLDRLSAEIAHAWDAMPGTQLLLGHGSGSFGHVPALKYGTRQGVHTAEEWGGFIEVWREATALNRLVLDDLQAVGLPAMSLPVSGCVTARQGQVMTWNLSPLRSALQAGLLPVIFGDVAFDQERGGTILSTEDLFGYLARRLLPRRILLAGLEPGVWEDFPARTRLVSEITPGNVNKVADALGGSAAVDVTGGMASKVLETLRLVQEVPGLEVIIFSGEEPDLVKRVLLGEKAGTLIHALPASTSQIQSMK